MAHKFSCPSFIVRLLSLSYDSSSFITYKPSELFLNIYNQIRLKLTHIVSILKNEIILLYFSPFFIAIFSILSFRNFILLWAGGFSSLNIIIVACTVISWVILAQTGALKLILFSEKFGSKFVFSLIIIFYLTFLFQLCSELPIIIKILSNLIVGGLIYLFIKTIETDPGVIPPGHPPVGGYRIVYENDDVNLTQSTSASTLPSNAYVDNNTEENSVRADVEGDDLETGVGGKGKGEGEEEEEEKDEINEIDLGIEGLEEERKGDRGRSKEGGRQPWIKSDEENANIHSSSLHHSLYCHHCHIWKPPRSRHCKICERCVSRYDHHCPAVSNCVGQNNHFYFILMLFFFLFSETLFVLSAYRYLERNNLFILPLINEFPFADDGGMIQGFGRYLVIMSQCIKNEPWLLSVLLACLFQLLWQIPLLCFQLYCVCVNITTYELATWKRHPYLFQQIQTQENGCTIAKKFLNPYDQGIVNNIAEFYAKKNVVIQNV